MNQSTPGSAAGSMLLACIASVFALTAGAHTSAAITGKAYLDGHVAYIHRDDLGRTLYTVLLKAPPAALYHGNVKSVAGMRKIPVRGTRRNPTVKLDLKSARARAYVAYLSGKQSRLVSTLQAQGMAVQPVARYQYALNGFTAWLSDADAQRIAQRPDVRLVRRAGENVLDTVHGPGLIGAPKLWFGNNRATEDTLFVDGFEHVPPGNRGAGVVIGDIDSGINFDSHAFDDPDPSGFHITNPLGDGNFLGWCNAGYAPSHGQVAADPCSNKIIGSYDFVHELVQGDPDANEPPGAEDEGGHGSHTASIAAGNTHAVRFIGNARTISGVAPHANLVAYDACYTRISTHRGLCPSPATIASAEQAVRDGVVDALNYSIGGGGSPWSEPTSMALLSAVDSGIFVAAAAGNSGPGLATVEHQGPWVTTVAASTVAPTPDVMAGFSSRGPATFNLLKPDVTAPGVNILAAVNGGPNALGMKSGTSMSSPHVTGSAALLRNAHPGWTPMAIKSALMLTAKPASQLLQPDAITPAMLFDAGAGRIRVDQAAAAGLVMRESGINMLLADPAAGGDPTSLNLASLYDDHCITGCAFSRRMTGALTIAQQWDVTATVDSPLSVTVPASFTALPGASVALDINVDSSAAVAAGFYFGDVTLAAHGNPETPVLHMPIAVAVPPPAISVDPEQMVFSLSAGGSDSADLTISNVGGLPLDWTITAGTDRAYSPVDQQSNGDVGYLSSVYTPVQASAYAADDFNAGVSATVTGLAADGFQLPNSGVMASTADAVTFSIYTDAAGAPAGVPDGGGAAPVYSCTLPTIGAGSNGLSVGGFVGDGVALDTAIAASNGCSMVPVLTGGTYWLSVYPHYPNDSSGSLWAMFVSTSGQGAAPLVVSPTGPYPAWSTIPEAFGDHAIPGFAISVDTRIDCGASWLTSSTTTGQVDVGDTGSLTLSADSSGLAAGHYSANACIASNDPDHPLTVVPVRLTVN